MWSTGAGGFGCPFHGRGQNWREFSARGLAAVLMPAGQYSWKYGVRLFGITGEQETTAED